MLKQLFQSNKWNIDEYFGFTTVRNPWARIWSAHNYRCRIGRTIPTEYFRSTGWHFYQECLNYVRLGSDFLTRVKRGDVARPEPQVNFLLPPGQSKIHVIKLEQIRTGLDFVWHAAGLDRTDLANIPVVNASSEDDYRSTYDEEAIARVKSWYAEDIDRFEYQFLE